MGADIATIVVQLQYCTSHEFESTVERESLDYLFKKRMPCDEMMSHTRHLSDAGRTWGKDNHF